MSAVSEPASPLGAAATTGGRVTQRRVALSEWTKLRSVRSTRWSLLVAILLIVGIGILVCVVFNSKWPRLGAEERNHFHPLRVNLAGVEFAQLAFGVLGVLAITAEYSTGMIRATFSAVPKRLPVLWAKALVFGAVAFAVSLPAVIVVFFAGQAILSGQHIDIALSHPGVLRALVGAALFMTVMGLFGLGLGAVFRSTPAGISALAAICSSSRRSSACSPPTSRARSTHTCRAAPAAPSGRSTPTPTRSRPGPALPSSAPTRRSRSRSPRC